MLAGIIRLPLPEDLGVADEVLAVGGKRITEDYKTPAGQTAADLSPSPPLT